MSNRSPKAKIVYTSNLNRNGVFDPYFYVRKFGPPDTTHYDLVLFNGRQFTTLTFNRVDFRKVNWRGVKIRFCHVQVSARRRCEDRFIHEFPWRWPGCCAEAFIDFYNNRVHWRTWWDDGRTHCDSLWMKINDLKRLWGLFRRLGKLEHPVVRRPSVWPRPQLTCDLLTKSCPSSTERCH